VYNFRLKKICNDLNLEMSRGNDEQIQELYDLVLEEYKKRQGQTKSATVKKEVVK
jgi:hypothetical protein